MSPPRGARTALVTGGTQGIGLATALALGAQGVRCALTFRWGSADEGDVRRAFAARGAPEPLLVQADTADPEETAALLRTLRGAWGGLDALIINAGGANLVGGLEDYQLRSLQKSLACSAWPLVEHLLTARDVLGAWPRYVVAMSSTGPDSFTLGYDFMAASKAVLETLVRYLSWHLRDEDVRVNAVRSRAVRTATFDAAFGRRFAEHVHATAPHKAGRWVSPEDVAGVAVALCSGLLDGVKGQVLTVDRGGTFCDGALDLYQAGRDPSYQARREETP